MTSSVSPPSLVCINCKLRKKKCDKTRPSCGYCIQKKLDCQYPSGDAKYYSLQPQPLVAVSSPMINSSLLLSTALSEALLSAPTNIDSTIYLQVLRIIRSTGQDIEDISARYFRGMHSFIPIVSRPRFDDTVANLGPPPPASFSLLLLCICLVTYHPELSHASSTLETSSLYVAVKTLFTQVKASFPVSLNLVQAGVIIATYEYANGRVHDAFASIGACARLGYAARLHLASPTQGPDALQAEEEANTWWGIIICERVFFCEILDFQQPLATKVPDKEPRLPKDPAGLEYKVGLDRQGTPRSTNGSSTSSKVSSTADPGGFASMVQAALFLDQLFKTLELTDLDTKLIRLDGLDHTMRTFLAIAMDQSQGRWGPFCVVNAMIERALLILHNHILDQVRFVTQCKRKSPAEWAANSHTVLHTIIRMMGEIIVSHNMIPLSYMDAIPPATAYLVRATLDHVKWHGIKSVEWDCEGEMQLSIERFDQRWGFASPKYT